MDNKVMNGEESERHLQDKVDKEHIHRYVRVSHRAPHLQPQVLAVQEEEHTAAGHHVEPEIGEDSSCCRGDEKEEQEPEHSP
ncbi:hypothetical protein E2C01_050749 [Portunus trituberculatus]|uniref:Uncharacterized protein n=1 Tax=Portunus trituberculatus TaxID=210409 RepID=A0A5B7GHB4_PORTR|nr:hypothetical protein [Portunus trituberculatus]